MSYHGTLNRLTDDVQVKVLTAYESWQAGALTQDQFVELTAALIARANTRAVALADLALATTLSVELGQVRPTVGVQAPDDVERLRDAVTTLVVAAAAVDVTARLGRLATAEPAAAAQIAWIDGMGQWDDVEGWMRQLDADACELCQSWAADDVVFPTTTKMLHHPGCQCTPKPMTRKGKK